ncbi:hypothetical protein [Altericroceibacterium endophyticum]|uniref:hypothetical protein n=1 Tax=Altericroceibacterium endophyticum TaxID=1808508 RepID=UPI001371419E|nr:hypothetical protein [Altericroceibacterium endophyticum]
MGSAAHAQTAGTGAGPVTQQLDPEDEAISDSAQDEVFLGDEVIVVTGTNISGVKPVGSEAITLDRQAIILHGPDQRSRRGPDAATSA